MRLFCELETADDEIVSVELRGVNVHVLTTSPRCTLNLGTARRLVGAISAACYAAECGDFVDRDREPTDDFASEYAEAFGS